MISWTSSEEQLLKELLPRMSHEEISAEINKRAHSNIFGFHPRSAGAVRRKSLRWIEGVTHFETTYTSDPVDEQWALLRELREKYMENAERRSTGILPPESITRKILTISDIHLPFSRVDLIEQILDEHSDADGVVLNGDIVDGYAFSTFEKHTHVAAIDEYNMAFDLVNQIRQRFPWVAMTAGNHDLRRVSRYLDDKQIPKNIQQVLRPDMLARIANGERLSRSGNLVEKLDFDNVYYEQTQPWFIRIGKTIFAHPWAKISSASGFTAKRCLEYFKQQLADDEFDSIVVGHSHTIYRGVIAGKLLIEQGCLADFMAYSHSADLKYLTNSQMGYAVVYQDSNGNTCFNRSNVQYLGQSFPCKKRILA